MPVPQASKTAEARQPRHTRRGPQGRFPRLIAQAGVAQVSDGFGSRVMASTSKPSWDALELGLGSLGCTIQKPISVGLGGKSV